MTLRARWVMPRARWVTLRSRWVTLRALPLACLVANLEPRHRVARELLLAHHPLVRAGGSGSCSPPARQRIQGSLRVLLRGARTCSGGLAGGERRTLKVERWWGRVLGAAYSRRCHPARARWRTPRTCAPTASAGSGTRRLGPSPVRPPRRTCLHPPGPVCPNPNTSRRRNPREEREARCEL